MIKKKASLAVSNVLMEIYDGNPDLTEETLDTLVLDLLTKGPVALDEFQELLPNINETKATILQEQAYRTYIESVPELTHFLNENTSSEPDEFMKKALERFKEKDKEEYDENFVMIYDIGDAGQGSKEENVIESLVLQVIQQNKEKDLLELFLAFRPFLFDLLKRRGSFVNFIQALHRLSNSENIAALNEIKKLEIRDLLVLLVESCSEKSLPKLASWLANQFYPLPLVYLHGKDEYKINLECCLEFLYQVKKPLITSIGTKSSIGLGKSALLSYLFSSKRPIDFSTKNGYTHPGSIDLYVSLPSEQQKCIISDIHGFTESSAFNEIFKKILMVSQLVLVHITEKEVIEDLVTKELSINFSFELDKNVKVLYLWRDFRKIKMNTLKKLEKTLENIPNVLGVLPISNLSADQNIDIQNEKLDVFNLISQKINENFENKSFTPLQDLQKALGEQEIFIDKERQDIAELLEQTVSENENNQDLISKLFPCFWTDCQIIEERKRRKTIDRITPFKLADDELKDLSKKYDEMQQIIQRLERQKDNVIVGDLTKEIVKIISSNNLQRILLLAETINTWKKNKIDNNMEFSEDDVSLSTFIDEIMSFYDSAKNKNLEGYKEIKQYLLSNLKRGDPINIVNGKTLKFGSSLLDEIFTEEMEDVSNIFVISIIGAQSSAKSTLLNMLFGCGFSTSAGRCTKGIYISLLSHPSGFRIVVIDTEGLLSVIARDHEFDNLITTMTFSCSHVIIINNKGEINSKLKDLLEICVYAMKHLKLSSMKPKIIFALRDIANNSTEIQQGILLQMKSSLEEAANKFSIDINKMISFSKEDIFLLPSAFQPFEGENKMIVQLNNNLFSSKVLEMRQYIFNYLGQLPKDSALQSLGSFYELTKQLWSGITELGKDIMRARNFLEIELRDGALGEVDVICKKYNELLRVKGQSLLKHETKLLNDAKIVGSTDNFIELLMKEFMHVKNAAMVELDTMVIKNDKYAEISSYFQEFREMVEYYLRWQNQRFIMDWNSSVLTWKTSKNLSDFKTNLRQEINEKFKASGVVNMQTEVDQIFGKIKTNLKKEFEENHKKLHETQIKKLPAEIHKRFEGAQRLKNSDRNSLQVFLPTLSDLIGRVNKNTEFMSYDTQGWVKLENIKEFNKKKGKEDDAKTIRKEFNALLSKIDTLITSEPSEDSAFSVITACVSQIKDMEGRGVPVHTVAFMFSCFLEAMFKQYCLKIAAEEAKMKVSHDTFEEILKKEEKYVTELLGDSEDSYTQGLRCGKKWFKEARSKFYEKKAWNLHQEILEKIKKEFPSPESANIKAYESSFVIGNYQNVVKYVLGINKFIKEIYHKRIKTLTEEEIQANVEVEYLNFLNIINVLMKTLQEWEKENQDKEVSELASFLPFIYKEELLREYLPDLYTIKLKNLKVFIEGCTKELDQQKKNSDLKEEFSAIITKKLNDSLSAEYEVITGCQERCPLCHNKCIKPNIPHTDHHTNCHLLLAFSGTQHYITEEANLTCCIDPSNYKCKWFKSGKEYENYDVFINAVHPDWRLDFPTREKLDIRNSNVPEELIEAWVATRHVFVAYYKYKDKTPQKWLSRVPSDKVLEKDLVIEGYLNDERKISTEKIVL